jgi:surface protein
LDEQKAAVSYGILKYKDNFDLIHYCCTEKGSSGSPILKLSNNKVIGIHKEGSKFDYNKGTFLKEPIIEYINNYKNSNKFDYELNNKNDRNKNNEIRIKLKIDKKDINKRIYLLCNCPIDSNISEYNILNQLNESNTDFFIDEKKYKFQKHFIFNKEGIYSIKIKFKNCIKDCQSMFDGCSNIIDIDLSSLDTKNVKNMSHMFRECDNLSHINLSNFDTKK